MCIKQVEALHCKSDCTDCTDDIASDRLFFQSKSIDIFLISGQKHMLWVLEAPHRGASNEYPQHMFSSRNKKNYLPYYTDLWMSKVSFWYVRILQ